MKGYYTKQQLADGMRELLARLGSDDHPLSHIFLKVAEVSIDCASQRVSPGAPRQWTVDSHRTLFIYIHRRLYRAVLERVGRFAVEDPAASIAQMRLLQWHTEARKSIYQDFPWRRFPFRSKPSFGTLKDRYNKASRNLRAIDEFHAFDNVILLETIYYIWGSESSSVLAALPAPLNFPSPLADQIYNVLSERDGQILPPD